MIPDATEWRCGDELVARLRVVTVRGKRNVRVAQWLYQSLYALVAALERMASV